MPAQTQIVVVAERDQAPPVADGEVVVAALGRLEFAAQAAVIEFEQFGGAGARVVPAVQSVS
jgi:hypothetical protein